MGSPALAPRPSARSTKPFLATSEMAHSLQWPRALQMVILVVFCLAGSNQARSPYSACLRSCHHCKQLYGHNFAGHLCARTCLRRQGEWEAVCTDLHSIRPFLDLSKLVDYDWADTNQL